MIRIFLSQRFIKTLSNLPPEQRSKVEDVLNAVMSGFGEPHRHAGFGLRKLTREYYECRVDLHWRIVLQLCGDNLLAYDLMTHEEVRSFLRGR